MPRKKGGSNRYPHLNKNNGQNEYEFQPGQDAFIEDDFSEKEEEIFIEHNLPHSSSAKKSERRPSIADEEIPNEVPVDAEKITIRPHSSLEDSGSIYIQDEQGGTFIQEQPAHDAASNSISTKHRREKKPKEKKERSKDEISIGDLFSKRTKPRNYFINLIFKTGKYFVILLLVCGFSGLGAVLGLARGYVESLPDIDFGSITDLDQTTYIYDINGELLTSRYGSENREWADIEEIPEMLQNAFIAIEDVRFRRHIGVDFKRLIGSFILNMSSDSIQGGSTITQQLIKNTLLSTEQTYKRKIREAYLAIQLEQQCTKDEILEAYLNTIPLGGSIYGVKTAAMDYFGKELSELTLRECATLAGLTQNPSRYNPRLNYYSRNTPERTDDRANNVLNEMYENGFITLAEYDAAMADQLVVLEESPLKDQNEMLAFVEYCIYDVITQLLKQEGLEDTSANRSAMESKIRTEGYHIYTTIDPEKQKAAEQAVYNYTNYPSMRYDEDKYTIQGRNPDGTIITLVQPQASSVVIDYRTGYIVAMVGGRTAPVNQKEYNRAYQSTMPVGSSIKPITVYGPALDLGKSAGTIYYDTRAPIENWGTEKGYPSNNGETGYTGSVTMRYAVHRSLNTVAAQALMYDVGIDTAVSYLEAMNVDPDHINADGPGLALGTSGLTPLEMAACFATIANMGTYLQPISFTKITDSQGNVILDMVAEQETKQIYKPSSAYQLIDMLYTALNGGGSAQGALMDGQTVCGKTGTNSDYRGVYFAGFTGYYVGSVWIGSDAYKPLRNAQGGTYAAPLWKDIMEPLHEGLPNKAVTEVTMEELGIEEFKFCRYSGKLATSACPDTVTDIGVAADVLADPCDCHRSVTICLDTNCIATDYCPNTRTTSALIPPTSGQLANIYYNYPEIYRRYYSDNVLTINTECSVHTAQWQGEQELKEQLHFNAQRLLQRSEQYAPQVEDPASYQQLLALTESLRNAYNNYDTVSYDYYRGCYNDLYNLIISLGFPLDF